MTAIDCSVLRSKVRAVVDVFAINYGRIFITALPSMRARGSGQAEIDTVLVGGPRCFLTIR